MDAEAHSIDGEPQFIDEEALATDAESLFIYEESQNGRLFLWQTLK